MAVLRRICVLMLLTGVVIGALSAAHAALPATPEQTAEIALALGFPAGCITASISEVDPSWATAKPTNAAGCPQAAGTLVLHLVGGAWMYVTAASSNFGFCPLGGVPDAISGEFALCRAVTPSSYVLGSSAYAPKGKGFGTSKPRAISSGDARSGRVTQIRWRRWGSARAIGVGRQSIHKPGGGYYARKPTIELRASLRGRCPDSGTPAYRQLEMRTPSRPGGKLGPWVRWGNGPTIC